MTPANDAIARNYWTTTPFNVPWLPGQVGWIMSVPGAGNGRENSGLFYPDFGDNPVGNFTSYPAVAPVGGGSSGGGIGSGPSVGSAGFGGLGGASLGGGVSGGGSYGGGGDAIAQGNAAMNAAQTPIQDVSMSSQGIVGGGQGQSDYGSYFGNSGFTGMDPATGMPIGNMLGEGWGGGGADTSPFQSYGYTPFSSPQSSYGDTSMSYQGPGSTYSQGAQPSTGYPYFGNTSSNSYGSGAGSMYDYGGGGGGQSGWDPSSGINWDYFGGNGGGGGGGDASSFNQRFNSVYDTGQPAIDAINRSIGPQTSDPYASFFNPASYAGSGDYGSNANQQALQQYGAARAADIGSGFTGMDPATGMPIGNMLGEGWGGASPFQGYGYDPFTQFNQSQYSPYGGFSSVPMTNAPGAAPPDFASQYFNQMTFANPPSGNGGGGGRSGWDPSSGVNWDYFGGGGGFNPAANAYGSGAGSMYDPGTGQPLTSNVFGSDWASRFGALAPTQGIDPQANQLAQLQLYGLLSPYGPLGAPQSPPPDFSSAFNGSIYAPGVSYPDFGQAATQLQGLGLSRLGGSSDTLTPQDRALQDIFPGGGG